MRFTRTILTLNAGSSSLRFAVFARDGTRILAGKFERIGQPDGLLDLSGEPSRALALADHAACLPVIAELLTQNSIDRPAIIAHRVVHGGPNYFDPTQITPAFLDELRAITAFAPNHLPAAIRLMEAATQHWAHSPHLACFDTAFHRDLPAGARLLPLPRRYVAQGIRRYGFHGLSFSSVLAQLQRETVSLPPRLVLAHLGHGASLAAVRDGHCIDTTMGFTPAGGLVMSTRTGDLDPGVLSFIAAQEKLDGAALERLVTRESGLLGLSETSSDTRDLLASETTDPRAAEALAVFVHQARKHLGAMAAVLGGIDTLVFSGGIGENSAVLRARLCADFGYLGLQLDPARNDSHAAIISTTSSAVTVRIIAADEEQALADAAKTFLTTSPDPA